MAPIVRATLHADGLNSRDPRCLILHADDFGMNDLVNAGIVCAFSQGVLTSTSVLMNAPACGSALSLWKDLESCRLRGGLPSCEARRRLADPATPFDLGIHLNLTQGRPLTGDRFPPPLLDVEGRFPGVFGLAARLAWSGWKYQREIEEELRRQIEVLCGSGLAPTHLNAHQYVDLLPIVAEMIPGLLKRYGIPVTRVPWEMSLTRTALVRRFEPAQWSLAQIKRLFAFRHRVRIRRCGIPHPWRFFGTAHAGRIDLDLMRCYIASAGRGFTEIGMHPGSSGPPARSSSARADLAVDNWSDPLADLRSAELSLLTSPELAELLVAGQIRLARLSDLAAVKRVGVAA